MKQFKTIEKVKQIIPNVKGIDVALLYGSFGRNEANPNSDIDVQILVDENFKPQDLISVLKKEFAIEIQFIGEVGLRNKVVAYFTAQPKIELGICRSLDEINRNYLGSEISNIENTILFANNLWKNRISEYLQKIIEKRNTAKKSEKSILELIDKFIYEFENCSTMHRRSDAFQFYFFYNIALHAAVQLKHLSTGETKYNFLPKNFVANTLTEQERNQFYELKGTLFLPEANTQKRKLLDFFYSSIETLICIEKQERFKQFLESIFERDFFWNFRDISTHNTKIKSGVVYRTATMSIFQNENRFEELLKSKRIKTVVDLRADREIDELPYNENALSKLNYVKAQLDPWNQPGWFKEKHHYGTNEEIAYRFFGIGCNDKIKTALEAIINEENATAVHCFAGKDRTGILISLLHLLVDTPLETIYADYLASEVDVKLNHLEIVLNIVNEKGGIVQYLIGCGLQPTQIEQLKNKLLNGN
ncbi:MAG: tyrosine-protein phosphatase [Bacteroidetes bacterium]|nr:tyrosine-protein phosphatase [Bacteroidota bacterium]